MNMVVEFLLIMAGWVLATAITLLVIPVLL